MGSNGVEKTWTGRLGERKKYCLLLATQKKLTTRYSMILPWYWRSLPLNNRTGQEIFARLFLEDNNIATLLESPVYSVSKQPKLPRYSLCAGSPRKLRGKPLLWTPKIGDILPFLRQLLPQKNIQNNPRKNCPDSLPFIGGWFGWLGYDLAWEIETLPKVNSDPLPFPVAYWYEPESFAILDDREQILWLATTEKAQLDRLEAKLDSEIIPVSTSSCFPVSATISNFSTRVRRSCNKSKKIYSIGRYFSSKYFRSFSS